MPGRQDLCKLTQFQMVEYLHLTTTIIFKSEYTVNLAKSVNKYCYGFQIFGGAIFNSGIVATMIFNIGTIRLKMLVNVVTYYLNNVI